MPRPRRLLPTLLLAALSIGCDAGGGDGAMQGMSHGSSPGGVDTVGVAALPVPEEHRQGQILFDASCASCHGASALGSTQGPPLVHIVYEPNHHGDAAFLLAVERGVRAHHWSFGDMPPQPGVSREDVARIVGYVRWLQRQAGVY